MIETGQIFFDLNKRIPALPIVLTNLFAQFFELGPLYLYLRFMLTGLINNFTLSIEKNQNNKTVVQKALYLLI